MSYQTRRNNPFIGNQQNVGNIGQRRPTVTNNYVPGGQNKQGPQTPRGGHHNQHSGNTNIQFRNQQQQPQTPKVQQQQSPAKPQQQQTLVKPQQQPTQVKPEPQQTLVKPQQQQQTPVKPQIPVKPVQPEPVVTPQVSMPQPASQSAAAEPAEQNQEPPVMKDEPMNTTEQPEGEEGTDQPKKKSFWTKTKISKKEKQRRRNIRLSRVLQPKNAVMILHELVKNASFEVSANNNRIGSDSQFKAAVVVDGVEHIGFGRNKSHAKSAAAEVALKHYVKHNKLSEMKTDENGGEKMEIEEESADATEPWPWSQVASFALYKLFTSWGEDPNRPKVQPQPAQQQQPQQQNESQRAELRPSKKLPDHPENVNPVLLINQMLPHVNFDEIGMSGMPPNATFSFKCTVDGESFVGTGPNKKTAKKMAAFGACHKLLGINYPPDVYVPNQ